jgi:hypothetical protein
MDLEGVDEISEQGISVPDRNLNHQYVEASGTFSNKLLQSYDSPFMYLQIALLINVAKHIILCWS